MKIILMAIITLTFVLLSSSIYSKKTMPYIDKKNENNIRNMVQLSYSIVDMFYNKYKKGLLSETAAKKYALELLAQLRYCSAKINYISIVNSQGVSVMHPYIKEIVGTNILSLKDKYGNFFIKDIIKSVQYRRSSFTVYYWTKTYKRNIIKPKLVFNMRFKPWDWILGTALYVENNTIIHNLQEFFTGITSAKKERRSEVRNVITVSYQVLLFWYKKYRQGVLSEKKANEFALDTIKTMRYGKKYNNFIAILNTSGILIVHPYMPKLVGKSITSLKDKKGVTFIKKIIAQLKNKSECMYKFYWKKPFYKFAEPKVSYNKLFKPWNWIIHTSLFIK